MIKTSDILKLASRIFNEDKFKVFQKDLENEDKRALAIMVVSQELHTMATTTLESVYNGDCDFVIFNHYRDVKNLHDLVMEFSQEQYAIGT